MYRNPEEAAENPVCACDDPDCRQCWNKHKNRTTSQTSAPEIHISRQATAPYYAHDSHDPSSYQHLSMNTLPNLSPSAARSPSPAPSLRSAPGSPTPSRPASVYAFDSPFAYRSQESGLQFASGSGEREKEEADHFFEEFVNDDLEDQMEEEFFACSYYSHGCDKRFSTQEEAEKCSKVHIKFETQERIL